MEGSHVRLRIFSAGQRQSVSLVNVAIVLCGISPPSHLISKGPLRGTMSTNRAQDQKSLFTITIGSLDFDKALDCTRYAEIPQPSFTESLKQVFVFQGETHERSLQVGKYLSGFVNFVCQT